MQISLGISWFIRCNLQLLISTAISTRKYWIPFDLQSQAGKSRTSTTVGDHVGICRCRSFLALLHAAHQGIYGFTFLRFDSAAGGCGSLEGALVDRRRATVTW
jgi:hypothetical protein